jgi:ABC-type multidrug transport system, ATPase component
MIQVEKLNFKYKKKQVFSDFSLCVEAGKVYGLLGKNGAGKSTLLYLMTGLLLPQEGMVSYKGENVSKRLPSVLKEMFIVPEEFELPKVSLKQYLTINRSFYPAFSEEDLKNNLDYFELEPNIHLGALSLGQKKKVFMSFALAANTPLLIMDEPTNGLDIPGKSQFKKFIASKMTDERSIIISTHQIQDVEKLIDQVIIIEENKVLLNASVREITQKLRFTTGEGSINPKEVLYASPSIQGYNAIYLNENDAESDINLETLFNASLNNSDKIKALFN